MSESTGDSLEVLRELSSPAEISRELTQHLQNVFDMNLNLLRGNQSFELDQEQDSMALNTLDWLAKLLRAGSPNQKTLALLAEFFEGVSKAANNSENAWKESVSIANRVLAHRDNGRPSKELAKRKAIETFRARIKLHMDSEDAATRAAYDVYYADSGRTFEADDKQKTNVTKGSNFVELTVAQRALETTILPMLRKAKLIERQAQGRKRKG